jgi:hypothetical protein
MKIVFEQLIFNLLYLHYLHILKQNFKFYVNQLIFKRQFPKIYVLVKICDYL